MILCPLIGFRLLGMAEELARKCVDLVTAARMGYLERIEVLLKTDPGSNPRDTEVPLLVFVLMRAWRRGVDEWSPLSLAMRRCASVRGSRMAALCVRGTRSSMGSNPAA